MPDFQVAHILPWGSGSIGGVEQATLRVAAAANARGFASTIFCLPSATAVQDFFRAAGFPVRTFEPTEPSYRHAKNYLRGSWQLAREFRRLNIDLVHCADLQGAYWTALAGGLTRVPVITHVRSRQSNLLFRHRTFFFPVSHWVFVSRATRKCFSYRIPEERAAVLYDAVPAGPPLAEAVRREDRKEVRRELGIAPDAKVVGMIARISPQKDYLTLARAARRLIAPDASVRFLIVGDTEHDAVYREHYAIVRRMLAENGVGDYFTFTGFRTDTARLTRAMDVFVLSTHTEGLPLVLIEAMHEGVPVVATAIDGIPEIVIDGKTGLLYPYQDDEKLHSAVSSILYDERLRKALVWAAHELVGETFSHERFSAGLVNLYRRALGLPDSSTNANIVSTPSAPAAAAGATADTI